MMENQIAVGKLTEAVNALKDSAKDHGGELKQISKDIYAAKVIISVIGGLILFVSRAIAWLVNTYISTDLGGR